MHTLLILVSFALGLGGCLLCVSLLSFVQSPASRRVVQGIGLALPTVILALIAGVMAHFLAEVCFWTAPPADVALAAALSVIGATGIAISILLNGARAILLPIHMARRTWKAPDWLQARVERLVIEIRLPRSPQVKVSADKRPWALVAGPFKPHLVVSSGLVALLDEDELSAALCHELMHLRRGDLWWTTLGGALRDLTWFLPATRGLYALMLEEQELSCDDHVQGESRRLALASALTRVWQAGIAGGPAARGALALLSSGHPRSTHAHLEARVRRLLAGPTVSVVPASHRTLLASAAVIGIFALAQISATAMVMNEMGCSMYHLFMR